MPPRSVVHGVRQKLSEACNRGIEQCRRGDWDQGLESLRRIAETGDRTALPGLFYSYLGYGIARCQKREEEGLKLCQHAIKVEFYQPENYVNLARTQLLGNHRRAAAQAIRQGLKVDPNHEELLVLQRELGLRRTPILRFLSRSNPINRFLGGLLHKIGV
ncbi:MAG TPA: hypothetical protein VOA87_18370 [Thermoanaerobaculia bacterium]|nr:hypothetical protein [Thermoanaerobaculia bacterium]